MIIADLIMWWEFLCLFVILHLFFLMDLQSFYFLFKEISNKCWRERLELTGNVQSCNACVTVSLCRVEGEELRAQRSEVTSCRRGGVDTSPRRPAAVCLILLLPLMLRLNEDSHLRTVTLPNYLPLTFLLASVLVSEHQHGIEGFALRVINDMIVAFVHAESGDQSMYFSRRRA